MNGFSIMNSNDLGGSTPRSGQFGPIVFSQVNELLGAGDGILGLRRHGCQEELNPLLQLTSLSNRLKAFVVLRPMVLQVGADVEQWRR
jgi:hypothetical protein